MADQQASLASSIGSESNDEGINQILQLNDDCLSEIFRYFSPIELCCLSETCKQFQNIARIEFKRRWKDKKFVIPTCNIEIADHPRILRCFGDIFDDVAVTNFMGMSSGFIEKAFGWLERYCGDTLESVSVLDRDDRALPSSAARLMSKVKKISLYSSISAEDARESLGGCKELVELNIAHNRGPFHLCGLDFPNLRKLTDCVLLTRRISSRLQFSQIERFFESHSKLTDLNMQFLDDGTSNGNRIDLSFISILTDLETLKLRLSERKVIHTEALSNLKKIKKLTFDHSAKVATDIEMLENIPAEKLEELTLGLSEINDLVTSIGRFKSLTHLTITQDLLPVFFEFDVNISSLSQLQDSRLIQLKISCKELLEPETIVPVIRNLSQLKVVIFECAVNLTESICQQLVAVCSSQQRSIEIRLSEEVMYAGTAFGYIEKFNEQNGTLVRVRTV